MMRFSAVFSFCYLGRENKLPPWTLQMLLYSPSFLPFIINSWRAHERVGESNLRQTTSWLSIVMPPYPPLGARASHNTDPEHVGTRGGAILNIHLKTAASRSRSGIAPAQVHAVAQSTAWRVRWGLVNLVSPFWLPSHPSGHSSALEIWCCTSIRPSAVYLLKVPNSGKLCFLPAQQHCVCEWKVKKKKKNETFPSNSCQAVKWCHKGHQQFPN